MLALIFIIITTGIGVYVSYSMSAESADVITWLDYYRGGIIGLFLGGVILHLINKRTRAKEMRKKD